MKPKYPEMIPAKFGYCTMSHLVTEFRNQQENGDCEMLVTGFGWCRYSAKLSAVLINGGWFTY